MAYERWLRNKEIRDKRRQEQKERENAPKITLHFVDELTDRTSTFDIPNYYTCGDLTDYVASIGFLAKSRYSYLRYSIRELQEYRPYIKIKDTCLCNGDTLHVEFADAVMLRKSSATERFFEEYDVTVQWKKLQVNSMHWNYRISSILKSSYVMDMKQNPALKKCCVANM